MKLCRKNSINKIYHNKIEQDTSRADSNLCLLVAGHTYCDNKLKPHTSKKDCSRQTENIPCYSESGLTLIELLLAMLIFSIVATVLYTSLDASIARNKDILSGLDAHESAQACLWRMTADLTGLYVTMYPEYQPPGFNDPPDPYRVVGDETFINGESFSRLRFVSTGHILMSGGTKASLAQIVYYVTPDPHKDGSFLLRRSDTPFPYDIEDDYTEKDIMNSTDPILCTDVRSLKFIYFDSEQEPHETWNSDSEDYEYATPTAVEIRLSIGSGNNVYDFATRIAIPVIRQEIKDVKN